MSGQVTDTGAQGQILDTSGLLCPLPVLKARKALGQMVPGQELSVITTDPVSVIDIPHMCQSDGHELVSQEQDGDSFCFVIRRAPIPHPPDA